MEPIVLGFDMSLTAKRLIALLVVLVALGLARNQPSLMLAFIVAGAAVSIHPRNPLSLRRPHEKRSAARKPL